MAAPIFNLMATEEAKDGWKKPKCTLKRQFEKLRAAYVFITLREMETDNIIGLITKTVCF